MQPASEIRLGAQTDRSFPNLERISARNVDTYCAEQLAFSIDLIIAGAEKTLRDRSPQ